MTGSDLLRPDEPDPGNGGDAAAFAETADLGGATPALAVEPPVAPPPPVPAPLDIRDLDWTQVASAADPAPIRARIADTVQAMERLLDSGAPWLFDGDRADPSDQAIKLSGSPDRPLWFIGDLHGDLLTLEAALALIRRDPDPCIVLLGDLFDDEGFGLETLLRVFELVLAAPGRVCLVAGNHDEALSFDGTRFASSVEPADFSDFLNANAADPWIARAGRLAIRVAARAPRALFFPDGLLVAHGGFPLSDLHQRLAETGEWNDPACLADFVWTRAHPTARRKLPNRYARGSQFGTEDFAAFCATSTALGRPVTHMVRGHDHVEERWAVFPAYARHPILTTVALARRLPRERLGPYERVPTVAKFVEGAVPQVHRLHVPPDLVRAAYPMPAEVA